MDSQTAMAAAMLATLFATGAVCAADPGEPHDAGWAFALDNDVLYPGSNQDRDYTGGMSLTLAGQRAKSALFSLESPRRRLTALLSLPSPSLQRHSIEYGLTVFTPQELHERDAQRGDRPYATLVYVASTAAAVDTEADQAWISTLTLGAMGLPVVSHFQSSLHRDIGLREPVGWEHQVSDGGELTARYSVARLSRQWGGMVAGAPMEFTQSWRVSLGYLTHLSYGLATRRGLLNSPWWSYNPQIMDYAEKSLPVLDGGREHYGWGGMALHLRGYNAFLQGQFRHSDHDFTASELRPLVAEAWLGYTHANRTGWRFSYTVRAQSSEISEGPGDRAVIWGGVVISRSVRSDQP